MRKKSEIQKENEEFVKTYDDSQYPKPSVTVDIVIFGMFDLKEDNYRKISEKKLKVLLIQRGEACKLCLNGMPVPLLRNCYSIFNGTKYR